LVKRNPDGYHGYSYWNEEVEDQDNVEESSLLENFAIIDHNTYPLLFLDEDAEKNDEEKHYKFNMSVLEALEKTNVTVRFHIKRKHMDEWKTYDDFKIKVLHDPDGFQMYHAPETDGENMIKDTWFAGDLLSIVNGMRLEVVDEPAEETEEETVDLTYEELIKFDTTEDGKPEPDISHFYIEDWNKIIDPNTSSMKKYPLFVRDKHSSDHWIINYDVLCKALAKRNVILDISFKMKDCRAQAHCSCNVKDVEVHVGGSVITGRKPGKKDTPLHDAAIEFRADDWKMMDWAHVNLRTK
jgi:hypothetical protein